jgi:hypothetical protein
MVFRDGLSCRFEATCFLLFGEEGDVEGERNGSLEL